MRGPWSSATMRGLSNTDNCTACLEGSVALAESPLLAGSMTSPLDAGSSSSAIDTRVRLDLEMWRVARLTEAAAVPFSLASQGVTPAQHQDSNCLPHAGLTDDHVVYECLAGSSWTCLQAAGTLIRL